MAEHKDRYEQPERHEDQQSAGRRGKLAALDTLVLVDVQVELVPTFEAQHTFRAGAAEVGRVDATRTVGRIRASVCSWRVLAQAKPPGFDLKRR